MVVELNDDRVQTEVILPYCHSSMLFRIWTLAEVVPKFSPVISMMLIPAVISMVTAEMVGVATAS